MRPLVFFAVNISGTITRLILIVLIGEAFSDPIDWLLNFIQEYRWYLLAVTATIGIFVILKEVRQGTGEISQLRRLGKELDHTEESSDPSDKDTPKT